MVVRVGRTQCGLGVAQVRLYESRAGSRVGALAAARQT
jgi:hypothetical protein